MPIHNRIFDNGISLITEPIAATKAAAIGFWFPTGSRDEGSAEHGVAHFIEHRLFKGTSTLSAFEIARFFDRIGGYLNAFTEREMICVHCLVPGTHALEALDILVRMIYDTVFNDTDVETERSVIESEILTSLDDPEESGLDQALALVYPRHDFSRPIAGTVSDVRNTTYKQILEYLVSRIRTIPPLVSVAGCFDQNQIERRIAGLKVRLNYERVHSDEITPFWHPGFFLSESRFKQTQLYLAYPVTDISTSSAWFSWAIINAIIGDTVSSRLYQTLREKNGLCYSLYSFFSRNRDSAFWITSTAVPQEKTAEAIDKLVAEMELITKSGFLPNEISDAKLHLEGELLLSAEDTENRMKRLARQFFYDGAVSSIEDSIAVLGRINADEVNLIVDTSFSELKRALIVYAGKKTLREIRKKWK